MTKNGRKQNERFDRTARRTPVVDTESCVGEATSTPPTIGSRVIIDAIEYDLLNTREPMISVATGSPHRTRFTSAGLMKLALALKRTNPILQQRVKPVASLQKNVGFCTIRRARSADTRNCTKQSVNGKGKLLVNLLVKMSIPICESTS